MQGKIVGGYTFVSKKNNMEWCNLYVEVPAPDGAFGICVEKLMCSVQRLPEPLNKMIHGTYFISTQNNFASDFYRLPDSK